MFVGAVRESFGADSIVTGHSRIHTHTRTLFTPTMLYSWKLIASGFTVRILPVSLGDEVHCRAVTIPQLR